MRSRPNHQLDSLRFYPARTIPPQSDGGTAVREGGAHLEAQEGRLRMSQHIHTRIMSWCEIMIRKSFKSYPNLVKYQLLVIFTKYKDLYAKLHEVTF